MQSWLLHSKTTNVIVTSQLTSYFIRELPTKNREIYNARLQEELKLIESNQFEDIFIKVVLLLRATQGIQHIVRGSAAGSLVSYMLGITHIDPVEHGMCLARFMNPKRANKPDIDLDFPQHLRDDIIQYLFTMYPNRVGRVCNHVNYRVNSAYQKVLRRSLGYQTAYTDTQAQALIGKHRYDSTHCGGVVIFDKEVPKKFIGQEDKLKLDKREVEAQGLVKIDILSNRGLSILNHLDPVRKIHEYPFEDEKIAQLLRRADVIGITYCESPVIMRIIRMMLPKNPIELSLCLALIRPAPDKKLVAERIFNGEKNLLVYDDDIIEYISEILECDTAEGEVIRKKLIKGECKEFEERCLKKIPKQTVERIVRNLEHVDKYSFCKSHAYSYGYLCWALLWHKAHNNKEFWKAVLLYGRSQYEDWVYFRQSQHDGHKLELYDKGTKVREQRVQRSILSYFGKTQNTDKLKYKEFLSTGCWGGDWPEDCGVEPRYTNVMQEPLFYFKGIVACGREYKVKDGKILFLTIGVKSGEYWNLTMDCELPPKTKIVEGAGLLGKQPFEIFVKEICKVA